MLYAKNLCYVQFFGFTLVVQRALCAFEFIKLSFLSFFRFHSGPKHKLTLCCVEFFLPLFLWTLFLGRFFLRECISMHFSCMLKVLISRRFFHLLLSTHIARALDFFQRRCIHSISLHIHNAEWRRFFRAEKEFNVQREERWWRKKKAAKTTNSRRDSGQCTLCTFHFQMNGQQNPALKEHKNEFCIFTFLSRFYDFLSSFCRQNCCRVRWDAMNAKSLFRTSRGERCNWSV